MRKKLKTRKLLMTYEDFLAAVPVSDKEEAEYTYVQNSFHRIYLSSAVFLCIALLSLASDIRGGYYGSGLFPLSYLNLYALCILTVSSILILIAGLLEHRHPFSKFAYHLWHLFFYIALGITLTLLFFGEFVRGNSITYSQCYWIFYAFVPILYLRWNFINVAVSTVVYTAEYFVAVRIFGVQLPNYFYFLTLLFALCLFGLYLRDFYMKTIIYTLKNRALTEELRSRSQRDSLTGCLNRYVMHERFEYLREITDTLSVLMFDIDNFKIYNDGFTHIMGDECLVAVSHAASLCCEGKNAELFRYGGEEFVIFATGLNELQLRDFATSLIHAIDSLHLPMPKPFAAWQPFITISLGAAMVKVNHGSSMKDVIAEADAQLYLAKEKGKNCICYNNEKYI